MRIGSPPDKLRLNARPMTTMTRSVHDNFVLSYTVDCEGCSITLHTEYRDRGEPFEKTDVRFERVIGYLVRDGLGGILFDIEEDSIDRILEEHSADFTWGAKYGWPWSDAGGLAPRDYLKANGGKVFRIQGQNCFDGFVIARNMVVEAVEHADAACGPSDRH